jgi:hypothetical protein
VEAWIEEQKTRVLPEGAATATGWSEGKAYAIFKKIKGYHRKGSGMYTFARKNCVWTSVQMLIGSSNLAVLRSYSRTDATLHLFLGNGADQYRGRDQARRT